MTVVPTDAPPEIASTKLGSFMAPLQLAAEHHL